MSSHSNPIRVMLADDHDTVRRGLAVFLRSFTEFELVGEASNGQEAIDLCAELQPDVILMDMIMPEVDGIAATRHIHEHYPETQIIALTSFDDDEMVQSALDAGAISYLLKDVPADVLAEAIFAASG